MFVEYSLGALDRGGKEGEWKSYNLTESHGSEGNDEEDGGTHDSYFEWLF